MLGHELAHEMATKNRALYRRLVDAIQPYVEHGKYPEFLKSAVARNVQGDRQREEFIGEVLSDGFMDREFWRALGNKTPGLLRQVGEMVMRLVEKVLRTVGYTKRTEKYLTDYKRVMQLAGEVMAEYAVDGYEDTQPAVRFNRADPTDSVCFAMYIGTGQVRWRQRGIVIVKWTMIAAFGFFAVLITERIVWPE